MNRRFWTKLGLLTLLGIPVTAEAGWREVWQDFWCNAHQNGRWPEPFATQDRDAVRRPFEIMKDNGWRFEHTLPEGLFNPETQELNRAGELKVRRIATLAPSNRRAIFVQRGKNDQVTQRRMTAVQDYLAKLPARNAILSVMPTDIEAINSSGDYYDQIDQRSRESIPNPVLPVATAPGTGGTGGM